MAHKSLVKAIAKQLDAGMICYVHKRTRKIVTVIDLEEGMNDTEERQAKIQKLDKNTRDYMKVPRMSSFEAMHVRQDFIKEPINAGIKKELTRALNRKNPVRNFKNIIHSDEEIHQYWLNFKADWYAQWVEGYLLDTYFY